MIEFARCSCCLALETIYQPHEWSSGQCSILGLAHFRRCHHLHCLGYLRRTSNRFDASANVAGTTDAFISNVGLKVSTATLRSPVRAWLTAFSLAIFCISSALRNVR